jgi:hypothetical protein
LRRFKIDTDYLNRMKEKGFIKGFFINPDKHKKLVPYNKFRNIKVVIDGKRFASKKEARRYVELRMKQTIGEISELECQVKYVLIEKSATEKQCAYFADFRYRNRNDEVIVEDTKGKKTDLYIMKRKLMLEKFGIKINEL